jgi:hypothetical protein
MKPYWLLGFLGAGGLVLIGCAPDAPTGAPLTGGKPANVYSYTYLCELGTPGYESYCEDFGSQGANGSPWLPCPAGLSVDRCHQFDATLNALISSGDPGCMNAAQIMRNEAASGAIVFKDSVVIDPNTGIPETGASVLGGAYTELYDDAWDDENDLDYIGDPTRGFLDVNFDLATTFIHEYVHQTGQADENIAEAAGQYCSGVLRTNQLNSYPAPMRRGLVPPGASTRVANPTRPSNTDREN